MNISATNAKRVLIYASSVHSHCWLWGLVRYYDKMGARLAFLSDKPYTHAIRSAIAKNSGVLAPLARKILQKKIAKTDHVFLFNGELPKHQMIRQCCIQAKVPLSIVEVGYFPQRDFFVIDSDGINATSSLITDSLDWVNQNHLDAVEKIRKSHLKNKRWVGGGDYILIPLQLADDTNIVNNSGFTNMQEFIDHCTSKFAGKKLVFKRHPLDSNIYQSKHPIKKEGVFWQMAIKADLVYGINSTTLLESLLLGAPTKSIGKGFIATHHHQTDKLLAALVDKQIPIGADDMHYWLDRYCAK